MPPWDGEKTENNWELRGVSVGLLQTNAYLLTAPKAREAILVDPGEEPQTLLQSLEGSDCRLIGLLCTHGHFDHVGAAAAIQEVWNLPLICHPLDVPFIQRMPEVQRAYGFPPSPIPRLEPTLAHGQQLVFAKQKIEVRHVPGHSPGHVMFVLNGDALVGDCVFAGSVGRTDLPGGDFSELTRSIREEIYSLPNDTRLHPGHGPATQVGREKATNPFVRQSSS